MDPSPPLCSVIIPTYNRERLLRLTLESLTRQTLPLDSFEVVVVDDGSTDRSEQVVGEFEDRLMVRYAFQEDEGYRVAAARNLGLTFASAEICVFVDSGVILHSGCLAAHLESHRASPVPVAVCGYVYCFNEGNEDGSLIEQAINYEDPDVTIAQLREQGKWLDWREGLWAKYGDDGFGDLPAPWIVYITCNASAPTAAVRAVGGFDETYRSWGTEDIDLAYRLHQSGARFEVNRAASAIHVPHPKNFAENMKSVAANYRYFVGKFDTPITRLGLDYHPIIVNELILQRNSPAYADLLNTAGSWRPGS